MILLKTLFLVLLLKFKKLIVLYICSEKESKRDHNSVSKAPMIWRKTKTNSVAVLCLIPTFEVSLIVVYI